MKIIQVAKYYHPLNSAQAYQTTKLTEAIRSMGIEIESFVGLKEYSKEIKRNNITYIKYSYNFLGLRRVDRIIKEILQISNFNVWVKKTISIIEPSINENSNAIVLTQSTPFENHLIGYYFKKKKIKWVAAFSDPFPISIAPPPYKGSNYLPFIRYFQRRVLRKILSNCDHVLVSSESAYKLMCEFSSISFNKKYSIVPHIGMDIKDETFSSDTNGWLIHTGNVTKERVVKELFIAILNIKKTNKKFKGVQFIGKVCSSFREMIVNSQIENNIILTKEVSQHKLHDLVSKCSGLLVIEAEMNESPFLPSKFADYATLCKPILAITPKKSQIRNYLDKFGGGIACSHNVHEIEDSINMIINKKSLASPELAHYFTYSNVGMIYEKILKRI